MKFLKVLFFLICVFAAIGVHAQTSQELKQKRDRLNNELDQLNREYQETLNNKKATLKQVNILKAQINVREEKINNINSEVRNLDNQITSNTNNVHDLQSKLEKLKLRYAAMVLFAYQNRSAYNKLMFVFAAKDFSQAYKRLKYLQQISTYRERQANTMQEEQKELHVKITELDKTKEAKHTLLIDQQKEKATLGKERNDQMQVAKGLSKQELQLKSQQETKLRERSRLNREIIAKTIEEERRKEEERRREEERQAAARAKAAGNTAAPVAAKPAPRKTNSEVLNATPEAAKLSNDFLGNRGRLPWPVANGETTQGFGTYFTKGIRSESSGLDIRTGSNAPVRAVFEGEVRTASSVTGTYTVIIRHGEYFTVYSNLRSVSVSQGQKVSTRQNIGTAATDQASGETEVHFELWKVSTPVDPKVWLADR